MVSSCTNPDELAQFEPEDSPPRRLMAVLDQDGDALLSPGEFERVAHPGRSLADHDLDGNALLDAAELRVMLQTVSPLLPDYRGAGLNNGAHSPGGAPSPAPAPSPGG